jgi:hypothetical protein
MSTNTSRTSDIFTGFSLPATPEMIEEFAVNNLPMRKKLSRLSPPSAKSLSERGIASLSA